MIMANKQKKNHVFKIEYAQLHKHRVLGLYCKVFVLSIHYVLNKHNWFSMPQYFSPEISKSLFKHS